MNKSRSIVTSIIAKVSTPPSCREGLGVRLLHHAWLLCLLVLGLASCGPDASHGRVKGTIEGIKEAEIFAYVDDSIVGHGGAVDTIYLKRGSFTYDRPISQPTVLHLIFPDLVSTSLVVEPGKTVKLKGEASGMEKIEVDGNEDNILLTEFRLRNIGRKESDVRMDAATTIRAYPSSVAALSLFHDYFLGAETIETNPTESLLADLQKAQPKSPVVKKYAAHLAPLLATAPGKTMPAFSGPDLNGGVVSSSAYAGRNLFIVFCAQWELNGVVGFYNIKRCARSLDSKTPAGKLSFVFLSLDGDKSRLVSANTFEPLPGRIIFDGKGLSSPLVSRLGMRYIGGNILVGANGKILARDIPVDKWENTIPPLL